MPYLIRYTPPLSYGHFPRRARETDGDGNLADLRASWSTSNRSSKLKSKNDYRLPPFTGEMAQPKGERDERREQLNPMPSLMRYTPPLSFGHFPR